MEDFNKGAVRKSTLINPADLPTGFTAPMLQELLSLVAHTTNIGVIGQGLQKFVWRYPSTTFDVVETCLRLTDARLHLVALVAGSKLHAEFVEMKYEARLPGATAQEFGDQLNFFIVSTYDRASPEFKQDLQDAGWESTESNLTLLATAGFTVLSGAADVGMKSAREVVRACMQCSVLPPAGSKFRQCARCKMAVYCCRDHQRTHWPKHKKMCTSVSV